ncbi:hypothetical protein BASA83_005677 [Batrachochytrium salamandrivorans]|nr:hypothetical protein BASA83_005677 [Batrachochytrium salamandrivorans]
MYELRGNSGGKDPNSDPFVKVWKKTKPGSRSPMLFSLTRLKSVNTLGQAYLRPMGVLNDAMCYSSCEVFSGSIQGHSAGTIFGEDGRTGGAGAAVLKLDPFLIRASPSDFQKFPFSQELTSGSITYANALSVGFTQTIRTGRYKGQGIEDYDRIAASLARTGQKNGQSRLHFVCEPFEIEKPIGGFPLEVESAGIYEFTVFQADGKTVAAKQRRSLATNKQKFSIPVSAVGSALGKQPNHHIGKTAGKQVLKTIRNVKVIQMMTST